MPTPGVINTAYLDSLVATVRNLTSHGLYVLLDIHQDCWGPTTAGNGFPDWMTITHGAENTLSGFPRCYVNNPAVSAAFESFWANETGPDGIGLQDFFGVMWAALAEAVGADPGVLGYDLLNEPWPGTGWVPCLLGPGGCADLDRGSLDPFHARMAAAIRAHDPAHLIFAEPFVLFNFGLAPTNIAVPGGGDGGLSFHMYPSTPADEPKVIANALAWAAAHQAPIINTEFSAVLGTPSPEDTDRQVSELDAALVPWIWWEYRSVVTDLSRPPEGNNVNAPVADMLVRPHPVAVAGTPTALTYDSATRAMTFVYDTTGPRGAARITPGIPTVLSVPRRTYPDGYRVMVAGADATITRDADRGVLLVSTSHAVATVTVSISPGAACSGDCNADGSVSIDELMDLVNLALGHAAVQACSAGDTDGNRQISIDEIIAAVNDALAGCE